MVKNIVFCADGTWNSPNEDEDADGVPDWTNVYKLFLALKGEDSPESKMLGKEQERAFRDSSGNTVQIAKYIHGVGDSGNPIRSLIGGAFGAGVIKRIVRGYTFISRNYCPGDQIYIVGFSRGAYTARALAGLIASQGLLKPDLLLDDKKKAYRRAAAVWYQYREKSLQNKGRSLLATFAEVISYLPGFMQQSVKANELIAVDSIRAVAVWDTVGAMGIPRYTADDACYDAYAFADTQLSTKVAFGRHAISCDEQRVLFTPTLWDTRDGIEQLLFPGAHADVGGGYPRKNNESALSDGALCWMLDELTAMGLHADSDGTGCRATASAAGVAHRPWVHTPWDKLGAAPRNELAGLQRHPSIDQRCQAGPVIHDPGLAATPYAPFFCPPANTASPSAASPSSRT